jgi:hypothetical protein
MNLETTGNRPQGERPGTALHEIRSESELINMLQRRRNPKLLRAGPCLGWG